MSLLIFINLVILQTKYGKNYQNETMEKLRMDIFRKNIEMINQHNLEYTVGLQTFELASNFFTDLTLDEIKQHLNIRPMKRSDFQRQMVTLDAKLSARNRTEKKEFNILKSTTSVDWRKSGKVAPIQDQLDCGSCWAFASVSAIESLIAIKSNKPLIKLSEQNVIDCATSPLYYGFGCNGGDSGEAMRYIVEHGIVTSAEYPYDARQHGCPVTQLMLRRRTFIADYDVLVNKGENVLINRVSIQPIGVAIETTLKFFHYSRGIYSDPTCTGETVDHGVNVVGYDNDALIVRNTWGSDWGENGYIRMKRGDNTCGINNFLFFPLL